MACACALIDADVSTRRACHGAVGHRRADDARCDTAAAQATSEAGATTSFTARVRIDTPEELEAFRHGGILPYVLRKLAAK